MYHPGKSLSLLSSLTRKQERKDDLKPFMDPTELQKKLSKITWKQELLKQSQEGKGIQRNIVVMFGCLDFLSILGIRILLGSLH